MVAAKAVSLHVPQQFGLLLYLFSSAQASNSDSVVSLAVFLFFFFFTGLGFVISERRIDYLPSGIHKRSYRQTSAFKVDPCGF
jgi:hypothetical protein